MPDYRIILADDHVILREGIKRIIQENPEFTVIGQAGDGLELLQMLEETTPDLVIIDLSMPRLPGIEAIKLIKGIYPEVKVLVLTMHKDKDYLYRAMDNGAAGYVLKDDASEVLLSAIDLIRQGKTFITPSLFS